jgi:surface antigen
VFIEGAMTKISAIVALSGTLALAGCGSTVQTTQFGAGPVVTAPPVMDTAQPPATNPAQSTADARAMTDVSSFLDPQAAALLGPNSRNQAAGAQFNALQFGRPGAPRAWQGDAGQSGSVTVGPYVRVNSIDCRDYTHVVTVGGKAYTRKGTACREADGHWSVSNATG